MRHLTRCLKRRLTTVLILWLLLLPAACAIADGDARDKVETVTIKMTLLERKILPQLRPRRSSIETHNAWDEIESLVKLTPRERKIAYKGQDDQGRDLWDLESIEPVKIEFTEDLVIIIAGLLKKLDRTEDIPLEARTLYDKFINEAKKHGLL